METTSETASYECSECGAPLPAPDETGARRCTFCKTVKHPPRAPAAEPRNPPASLLTGGSQKTRVEKSVTPIPNTLRRQGCGVRTLIAIPVIVVIAAVAVPLIGSIGGLDRFGFGPALSFTEASPALLPGEPGAPLSFVTMSRRYDQSSSTSIFSLVKSDGVSPSPVWSTDLSGDAYGTRPILTDGTSAILAIEDQAFGVALDTGAIRWQTPLTDVVQFNSCNGCFTVVGTNLVAVTDDDNVQAIDTTTGATLWSRRLDTTDQRTFAAGAHVVIVDSIPGGDGDRLVTLDPATGQEVASIAPTCDDPAVIEGFASELSSSSELLVSSSGERIWFLEGGYPTCIQQYDVSTGALVSQVMATSENGSFASPTLLDTPLGLVVTSGGNLGIVDPTGTTYRAVLAEPDTNVMVVGTTDTAVMIEARTSRGTAKTSIRAIDPNSGSTFWTAPMGAAVAAETEHSPPGSFDSTSPGPGGVFTAHVDHGAVQVVTFRELDNDAQQLTIDSFDAVTGAARPAVTHETGGEDIIPFFGPGVWSGSRLLTAAGDDRMVVVDADAQAVTYTFR